MANDLAQPSPTRQRFFTVLWGIIRHPGRTFEGINSSANRSWLLMSVLAMVLVLAPVIVAAPITRSAAVEAVRAQQDAMAERGQEIPPEAQEQMTSMVGNPLFTVVLPAAGVIASLWVSWLAWAGALHLLSTMLGGSSVFRNMWQGVVWSWLPFALRGFLQTVFIVTTGETIQNPGLSGLVAQSSNPAGLFISPPSTGQLLLQAFLSRLDLFLVWNLILLVLAVAASARISRRKATLITLVIWLLFTIIAMVPVLISGAFVTSRF